MSYYRRPKTANEARQQSGWDADAEECPVRIRERDRRRGRRPVVDSYDDLSVANRYLRSWKHYRLTRWR